MAEEATNIEKAEEIEKVEKAELRVLQGNNRFATNLYKVLAEESEENVFFSPISVHAVLSMVYQGAQDTTARLFAKALHVPEAQVAAEGYNSVINLLNSVENVTLLMANRVYLMEGAKMLENFNNVITKQFLSEVQVLNFANSEESAKTINAWVEEQTREKIKDLISKDDLSALTRLVLVNAIYFKGNWKHKFDQKLTTVEPFYLNDDDKVDVGMMHIKKKFNYKNDGALDAQILQMFYSNEDLSMIIILPNKRNGIKELEEKLVNVSLADVTKGLWETDVTVALPRFKIEQNIDLEDALTKLGLGEIFDKDKANFKGMIELSLHENLYVSKAVQKAFIEVNEEGAEAAAATGIVMAVRCSLKVNPQKFFIADHPFIFHLVYKETSLFSGRIGKPSIYE